MGVQTGDLVMVERSGVQHRTTAGEIAGLGGVTSSATITLYQGCLDQNAAGWAEYPITTSAIFSTEQIIIYGPGSAFYEDMNGFQFEPYPMQPVTVSASMVLDSTPTGTINRFMWRQYRGGSVLWESDPVDFDDAAVGAVAMPTQALPSEWQDGDILWLHMQVYDESSSSWALSSLAITLDVTVPAAVTASDPWTYVKLTADVTNSTTSDVATDLTITGLDANAHYVFEGMLFLSSAATTTGPRPGLTWPSGTVREGAWMMAPNNATAFASRFWGAPSAQNAVSTGVAVADETTHGRFEGHFTTGASPSGALTVTLRSEVAASEARIEAGSWMRWRKI